MTRDDIIRMAEEAGFDDFFTRDLALERFANLVAAHEREACAQVCENDGLLWGQRYAAAIRERGE